MRLEARAVQVFGLDDDTSKGYLDEAVRLANEAAPRERQRRAAELERVDCEARERAASAERLAERFRSA